MCGGAFRHVRTNARGRGRTRGRGAAEAASGAPKRLRCGPHGRQGKSHSGFKALTPAQLAAVQRLISSNLCAQQPVAPVDSSDPRDGAVDTGNCELVPHAAPQPAVAAVPDRRTAPSYVMARVGYTFGNTTVAASWYSSEDFVWTGPRAPPSVSAQATLSPRWGRPSTRPCRTTRSTSREAPARRRRCSSSGPSSRSDRIRQLPTIYGPPPSRRRAVLPPRDFPAGRTGTGVIRNHPTEHWRT